MWSDANYFEIGYIEETCCTALSYIPMFESSACCEILIYEYKLLLYQKKFHFDGIQNITCDSGTNYSLVESKIY